MAKYIICKDKNRWYIKKRFFYFWWRDIAVQEYDMYGLAYAPETIYFKTKKDAKEYIREL